MEEKSGGEDHYVKIFIRLCPNFFENSKDIVTFSPDGFLEIPSRSKKKIQKFPFKTIFQPTSPQSEIYSNCSPYIQDFVNGIDTTIFAYGQSGTGKTSTMLGMGVEIFLRSLKKERESNLAPTEADWGIIPRAIRDVLTSLAEISMDREDDGEGGDTVSYSLTCSYLQIYNDTIFDLISSPSSPKLIREDKDGSIFIEGLSFHEVRNLGDVMKILRRGSRNRVLRGMEYNQHSSRSHAILQLHLTTTTTSNNNNNNNNKKKKKRNNQRKRNRRKIRKSTLSMVDLAGSERYSFTSRSSSSTQTTHQSEENPLTNSQLKRSSIGVSQFSSSVKDADVKKGVQELVRINSSLSAFGNCISAIIDKNRSHIPYRDSPLTRILQKSLR